MRKKTGEGKESRREGMRDEKRKENKRRVGMILEGPSK